MPTETTAQTETTGLTNTTAQSQTYNQAMLILAQAGLEALASSASRHKAKRTPAQESHFLCNWMVESLKEKRFSKLVADDLTQWIRDARTQGAGAQLPDLLTRIERQYQVATSKTQGLGDALARLIEAMRGLDWLVITDSDIDTKLKLDGQGQSSLIISAKALNGHIKNSELIKPINLYLRGDENVLAQQALAQGLIVSQGNKKTSLIKHHKTYILTPDNNLAQLCLLIK
jgi:hypothetical protein